MNWRKLAKWVGGSLATVVVLVLLFVGFQIFSFNRAAAAIHDVPTVALMASSDSAVIARGQHVAEALGGCVGCHGPDLSGRLVEELGPIGTIRAPNLTTGAGGVGSSYTDAQLATTIRYGVRPDGTSLLFMPSPEHNWWPDSDLEAVISFVRSRPPVDNQMEPTQVGPLGKVLSSLGVFEMLSAQMVEADTPRDQVPAPEPTARYGAYVTRGCTGCHGPNLSGGPIPGAPADLPVPRNLTPHAEGLAGWTAETFDQVITSGNRPDGTPIDPFMPIEALQAMNEVERAAVWAYLVSLEPLPTGTR